MASFSEIRARMNQKYGNTGNEKKKQQEQRQETGAPATSNFLSIRSELERKYRPTYSHVNDSFISGFFTDAQSYLNGAQGAYNGMNYENRETVFAEQKKKADDLRSKSKDIRKYLNKNKDSIEADSYNSMISALDDFDKSSASITYEFYRAKEYGFSDPAVRYSGMSSAEIKKVMDDNAALEQDKGIVQELSLSNMPYNREYAEQDGRDMGLYDEVAQKRKYISDKYGVQFTESSYENSRILDKLISDLNSQSGSSVAYTTEGGMNVTWQDLYNSKAAEEDLERRLAQYSQNADWVSASSAINNIADTESDYQIIESLLRTNIAYDKDTALKNGTTSEDWETANKKRQYISEKYGVDFSSNYGAYNALATILEQLGGKSSERERFEYYDELTADEKKVLSYIATTQGREAALEWYKGLEDLLKRRYAAEVSYGSKVLGEQMPVFGSVASVVTNLGAAGEAILDFVTGDTENTMARVTAGIRGGVTSTVDWKVGNWDAFDFLYNTGMSLLDSQVAGRLLPSKLGNGKLGQTVTGSGLALGLSAAAQGINDAKDRGMSDGSAIMTGIVNGINEMLFESWSFTKTGSLGEFLKDIPEKTYKDVFKNLASNIATNAEEEFLTELSNIAYDTLINGDFSQLEASKRAFMASGMSETEATRKAWKQIGGQLAEAAASGALMGFGTGAVGRSTSAYNIMRSNAQQAKRIYGADPGALVNEVLEINPDNKFAQRMQNRLNQGKDLSGSQLNRLVQQNEKAIQNEAELDTDDPLTALTQDQQVAAGQQTATQTAEENLNGGNDYGTIHQQSQQSADAGLAGRQTDAGAGLLHGGSQRNDGAGAGEQVGGLAGRTGSAAQGRSTRSGASRVQTTIARQNLARHLQLEKVSALDVGLKNGTDDKNLQILPKEHWSQDAELQELAQKAYRETGMEPVFVIGKITVKGRGGGMRTVRAALTDNQLIVRADYAKTDATLNQLLDHEIFHYKARSARADGYDLNAMIEEKILERYTQEEFKAVLEAYLNALDGLYGVQAAENGAEFEAAVAKVKEELFADAYAGINAFNVNVSEFTGAVDESLDRLHLGRNTAQENGVRQTDGPPNADQYSIETLPDGKKYVRADRQVIFGNDPNSWSEQVEDYINGRIRRGQDVSLIAEDGDVLTITATTAGKLADNHTPRGTTMNDEDFYLKANAAVHIDELAEVSNAIPGANRQDFDGRHGEFASGGWTYRTAYFKDFDGKYYRLRISAAKNSDGTIVYNIGDVKERSFPTVNGSSAKGGALGGKTSFNESVLQEKTPVKQKDSHYIDNTETVFSEEEYDNPLLALTREPKQAQKNTAQDGGDRYSAEEDLNDEEWDKQYGLSLPSVENTDAMVGSFVEVEISDTEIEANITKAAQMAPVTQITGEEFAKGEKDLVSQVVEFFEEKNNTAHNDVLGDVVLDRRGVKSDIAHGIGRKKAAAFAAVPSVIEQGVVVDYQRNWKGRGYDTAVIAAPITIGTEEHIAAVVLTRSNQTNRFYVHEVMTTKNGATPFKTGTQKLGESGGNAPSVFSILDRIMKVKTQRSDVTETYSAEEEDNPLLALKGESRKVDYEALERQYTAESRNNRADWFKERLGEEGYQKYREYAADRDEQKKQQSREEQAQKTREQKARIDERAQEHIKKLTEREEKAKQAVKPTKAKKELKATVLNLFSVPDGQKAELGSIIDGYAERLLKNGNLTEEDRQHFFDRMYEAGVMTVPVDDYMAEARSYIAKGHIYVSPQVKAEFGDDWNSIRKRAFAANVYLVNDRSAAGIDQWNATLSAEDMLPGLFNSEDTDQREILERIIQVAEYGKEEKMGLAEYTAMLSGQGYVQEDEFLDSMERQLDFALRTFVQSAGIEISVKESNIKENAKLTRESIRQKARRAAEREERKEAARRSQAQKELREMQQNTLKTMQWLSKNRNKAPEDLKAKFDEVLGDIDLYAVGAADEMRWSEKYQRSWRDIVDTFKRITDKSSEDHDPNFVPSEDLKRIIARVDNKKIEDMDVDALRDLFQAAVCLQTELNNRRKMLDDKWNRLIAEVYTDSKREIEKAPGGYKGKKLDDVFNLEQLTSMNVLQRMGGWDPNGTFYSVGKGLENGERETRAYEVKAKGHLKDFLTENADWVKRADGRGKDAIWYEYEVPELKYLSFGEKPTFGDTVKIYMTPAQKVHLYLESKSQDNLRHMTGGRTFADKELYSKGKRQEAFAQGVTVRLAPETVKQLVSDLTPEELELAAALEKYYNSFARQEINRVSNILYGYDKAMGSYYAPIYCNQNYTKTEFGVFNDAVEAVGNMKERHISKNPTYNISALDAFERSVTHTARFCGFAIPVRNWNMLMNWQTNDKSMGDVIEHKWGAAGKKYITDMIEDLQAGTVVKTDTVSTAAEKVRSNYISAKFGFNLSIWLKQLGSIPMAAPYLGVRNIPVKRAFKVDKSLIAKYTQELEWRLMGYATPETKILKENPNWTETNEFWRFTFGGGHITAMDGKAASVLWPWAENKVRREYPELEVGTQAQIDAGESPFYKKVAEEFNDAVVRSQSVSDKMHQSAFRKSDKIVARYLTQFKSDSAQAYNVIRQKVGEARYAIRNGEDKSTIKAAKNAAGAAFTALLLNAVWGGAVNLLVDGLKYGLKHYRDDEDELTAESVAEEWVEDVISSICGTVVLGEQISELIGNIITGDKWYGLETPGMSQVEDMAEEIIDAIQAGGQFFSDVSAVAENDGEFGQYLKAHGNEYLGVLKNLAVTVAEYFVGVPVANVEAYLLGPVKSLSPEFAAAYDDALAEVEKNDLSGLTGEALSGRIGRMLRRRDLDIADETVDCLAALYEAGYKNAVPADIIGSVDIEEETHKLGAYEQQAYGNIWNQVVGAALEELTSSAPFARMDAETQAKTLGRLYGYATAKAKEAMFDYELSDSANAIDKLVKAGLEAAESVSWATATSGMKNGEKYAYLKDWAISDEKKRAIIGSIIGTDMKTEAGNPTEYAKMLDALKQGMTVNEYLDLKREGADIDDYLESTEKGMDSDTAQEFASQMEQLESNAGDDGLKNIDKWRLCVDFTNDTDDQLAALAVVMSDSQIASAELANKFGVTPDMFVSFYEVRSQYDADANGSYSQKEVTTIINSKFSYLTQKQKAVLWQIANGSTKSAKNNPYNVKIGQEVLDAKAATKG